ncbi:MAG TPA: hypothetical protein VK459_12580, partial [Polyangiaceae bacterium]|nr:hypothetical protein [Polyangiaceae bacterium]
MTRRTHRSTLLRTMLSLIGLMGGLQGGLAHADSATADRLFREAKSLMSQKRYTEACPKLAESHRAEPSGGTILHLAYCHKEEGRIATAYKELEEAVLFAIRDKRDDREKAAKTLMTELAPKIPKLSIVVVPEVMRLPGIEVKRDGVLVPPSEWGSPMPVDPGQHTVTAWAPGRKPLLKTVDLRGDAATGSVTISAIDMDPSLKADSGAKSPQATPTAAPNKGGGFGTQRKIAVVTGGLGLVALGVGTAFGIKAAGAKSASDDHCESNNICDDEGIKLRADGIAWGNLATGFFIGGGVATAAGVVIYLTAPSGGRASAKTEVGVTSVSVGPLGA